MQQAADANAAKATSMLASISDNSQRIDGVEAKATKIEAEVEGNKGQISDCLRRIESLERRQRAAREIDDQERKIKILQRRISPQEIKRAATFVALHGLPLPREGSTEQELSSAIARTIAQALGSGLAEYIFSAKDQNFANISSWISLPGGGGHAYSRITPENAKNSIIFKPDFGPDMINNSEDFVSNKHSLFDTFFIFFFGGNMVKKSSFYWKSRL